jgi:hypothetical protein
VFIRARSRSRSPAATGRSASTTCWSIAGASTAPPNTERLGLYHVGLEDIEIALKAVRKKPET